MAFWSAFRKKDMPFFHRGVQFENSLHRPFGVCCHIWARPRSSTANAWAVAPSVPGNFCTTGASSMRRSVLEDRFYRDCVDLHCGLCTLCQLSSSPAVAFTMGPPNPYVKPSPPLSFLGFWLYVRIGPLKRWLTEDGQCLLLTCKKKSFMP